MPVQAQEPFVLDETMEYFRDGTINLGDPCPRGVTRVIEVVAGWRSWDPVVVQEVAGALVEASGSSDTDLSIRAIAALRLLGAESDGEPGWPQTVKYLKQAFRIAPYPEIVISTTLVQSNTRVLGRVVRGDVRPDALQKRRLAASHLARIGVEGMGELRAIQRAGVADRSVSETVARVIERHESGHP